MFLEAGFDPKAWINAAYSGRPQEEPLERFLAELEMRLQVGWTQHPKQTGVPTPQLVGSAVDSTNPSL